MENFSTILKKVKPCCFKNLSHFPEKKWFTKCIASERNFDVINFTFKVSIPPVSTLNSAPSRQSGVYRVSFAFKIYYLKCLSILQKFFVV